MPHINEQYDFVIAVYIVFDGRALLAYHPRYDMWTPVGGHIELDEDPEEALIREVKEEAGLEVEILGTEANIKYPTHKFIRAPHYVDVHEANPPHKHIALTYFAKALSGDFKKSDEHQDMRWFSLKELSTMENELTPPVLFYARQAIAASMQSKRG